MCRTCCGVQPAPIDGELSAPGATAGDELVSGRQAGIVADVSAAAR